MASYIVTDRIRVNIVHSFAVPPRVKCEQYDGDYTKLIQATVYNGDVLYSIPSAVRRIVVSGLKPDNTGFSYDCTWSGNTVSFSLMRQMTVVDGKVPCNITMFDASNNQVSSAVFVLDVEKAALPSDVVVSSNDFQTFIDYVQAANLYWQYSKSFAVGNTGVREDENVDNAKYYAHLARMYKGSPLTASTISEMENVERVYVYVGNESGYNNGHWYFYDDNAWVDGGVYNSEGIQTDTELIAEGVAADAKAVGDILGHETLETSAQTLSGAVNELMDVIDLVNISVENGKFVFGDFSTGMYANQSCTDGTYFYESVSDYSGTNTAKLIKMDDGGNEIASVDLGNEHYGILTYSQKYDAIYMKKSNTSVFKISSDLTNVTTINVNASYISCVASYGNMLYVISSNKVYEFSDEFQTVNAEYAYTMPVNRPTEFQGCAIYKNLLFMACNYPNIIIVLNYITDKIVAYINIGDTVDGVNVGEIEGICVFEDGDNVNVYINGTKGIYGNLFYNKTFMLAGDFSKHILKIYGKNSSYVASYVVDGQSVATHSLGTSEYPFKSIIECLEHCHYKDDGRYNISVTHVNATLDKPSTAYYTEPINAHITFTNDLPSSNLKWSYGTFEIADNHTSISNEEISVYYCNVLIDSRNNNGAYDYLIVTNYYSDILVRGDIFLDYNQGGKTHVLGKTKEIGPIYNGITIAKELSKYPNTDNPICVIGEGLRYQKTLVFTAPGTLRIVGKQVMQGILAFSSNSGASYNRIFMVKGYGNGGSMRTEIAILPPDTNNGIYVPTVDPNANAINIGIDGSSKIRVTFTALGYTPEVANNSIGVELEFTPST